MENTSDPGGASARPVKMPFDQRDPRDPDPERTDLTGVAPLRLAEIRRRVEVVKSYLAIATPDDHARRTHALALGLSVNQFLALVRAWREHGRAEAISGAGASRGTPRPTGPRNLPTESKSAAREVVAGLGADVSHVDAVAAVEARCHALGVKAPSRSTVWNMIMAARRDARGVEGEDGLVVSRCHAKLPVERHGAVTFPSLLLVVDSGDGSVLAAAMEDDDMAVGIVSDVIRAESRGRRVLIDMDIARNSDIGVLADVRCVRPSAARTATAKALGRGFGSIELIYQISRAVRPEKTLRSRKDRPLQPGDARDVIFGQLSAHNAARGAQPPIVSWLRSATGSRAAA
ncbi:hypothetical protein ASE86_07745 [Sphingomonas sp. Leaf33]|uniref:hypothetical protein n=1 Tax=Sphingomonas sp. Leaf33 TaxID=1736215 RepID=UPI0006FBE86D|nr:hypothetical protein [Sphingomonas sp. Leaf33]KQN26046.1 hypothetical protein ASE86_07745 [Sphingomonas sp. Leaf33]